MVTIKGVESVPFIQRVQDKTRKFLETEHDLQIKEDRLAQIQRAKKAVLYWQGKQYLKLVMGSDQILDWAPIDMASQPKKVFAMVTNIIYGDGIKFCSLVGQRKINQRCAPDDPDDPTKVGAARNAFTMARYLHRYWRIQARLLNEVAQPLWNTGPLWGLVDYETNAAKHGTHSIPNFVQETQTMPGSIHCLACQFPSNPEGSPDCLSCGTPLDPSQMMPGPEVQVARQDGSTEYDRGMPELYLLDCLSVSCPMDAVDRESCGWVDYSQVLSKSQIRSELRRLGVKTMPIGAGEDANVLAAHEALLEIASPTGTNSSKSGVERHVWSRRWLRPSQYGLMDGETRRMYEDEFPDGCQLYRVDSRLVHATGDKLDDQLRVVKSGMGKHINAPGLCDSQMVWQDYLNDLRNMTMELILRGLPITIVDSGIVSREHLEKDAAQVAEIILSRQAGVDMSKAIATIPSAHVSAEIPGIGEQFRNEFRDICGVRPEIFGGGENAPTWRQASQKLNAARAQLDPPFTAIQEFISGLTEIGVKSAARHGFGAVMVTPANSTGFETVTELDLEALTADGWHVEAEENKPETVGEKIDRMGSLTTESPQTAQAVGLMHPINASKLKNWFGDPELYAPGEFMLGEILERIQELLMQTPMQVPEQVPDPMTGQMIQTGQMVDQSSIQPDPFIDSDHGLVAEILRTWCTSPAGKKAKQQNPEGFRNVTLHGLAQQMAAVPPPAPPGEAPPAQGAAS